MVEWMRSVFTWTEVNYPVDDALDAVDAKLRARYPDGFTPEKKRKSLIFLAKNKKKPIASHDRLFLG